jgi:hypothetical protein
MHMAVPPLPPLSCGGLRFCIVVGNKLDDIGFLLLLLKPFLALAVLLVPFLLFLDFVLRWGFNDR